MIFQIIRLLEPSRGPVSTNRETCAVRAEVRNITNINQVRLLLNGNPVPFRFENNILSSTVPLVSGLNNLALNARNECGEDNVTAGITYVPVVVDEPCTPPKVSYTVYEVNRQDATHELRGSVSGVENKAGISLTLDGRASSGFQFVPTSGDLNAKFKLAPGSRILFQSMPQMRPGTPDWQSLFSQNGLRQPFRETEASGSLRKGRPGRPVLSV